MAQQGIGILPIRGIAGHTDAAGGGDPLQVSAKRFGQAALVVVGRMQPRVQSVIEQRAG